MTSLMNANVAGLVAPQWLTISMSELLLIFQIRCLRDEQLGLARVGG